MTVQFTSKPSTGYREVRDIEELEKLIQTTANDADLSNESLIAELIHHSGASITFGIGDELSFINYTSVDGEPPYWSTKSKCSPDHDTDHVAWMWDGVQNDVPTNRLLPWQSIWDGVQFFFESGCRTPHLEWQEV